MHANFKLSIHWIFKVGGKPDSAQEEKKLGEQGKFCK
jgi:hypothetical protein